jgi:pseudolysin
LPLYPQIVYPKICPPILLLHFSNIQGENMLKSYKGLTTCSVLFSGLLAFASSTFAATPVDLNHQPASFLQSLSPNGLHTQSQIKQINSNTDFNKTQHVRLQQTYEGSPVWGGDFIIHIPNGNMKSIDEINSISRNADVSMDGTIYQNLDKDLQATPQFATQDVQMNKALQQAIQLYQNKKGVMLTPSEQHVKKIVYVDKTGQAHWAFLISFMVTPINTIPTRQTYIMDATNFDVYKTWDDIKTLSDTVGGGYGGNSKIGKLVYDGLGTNYPQLSIQRDDEKKICYLSNADVVVKNASASGHVIQYNCETKDSTHGDTYWNADQDAVNGGFSPSNDALFVGKVVKNMYQEWYGLPVLTEKNGTPMKLSMEVHLRMDNAYWNGIEMFFGDGISMFYPLVSLGVGAHEISHGFTEQHSDLAYYDQSGGLNEAFSDMASQAAMFYATKTNNWMIGDDIMKSPDEALRYMNNPTKDCDGAKPGHGCSIDNLKQYNDEIDVHYSSGIFNKFFYLLATSKKMDTHKAFNVMVNANINYWTSTTDFTKAACGVMKAAKDYKYPIAAVKKAASKVGIDVSKC